ncbi:error-prone DNA polymerase [Saccharopolyspora antimicrobica]|uniref:Error-prone DNA polymerase n=1 Tax=Saccharopolyspora antimicrobica TaxID=455193 RepID=A0A1I5D6P1_9PSEU|nr:error-prone DNA polymerase [Saccharopolyspora antimicrobica]RKT85223.1 DnaE-like error-prone DNA polymerase [Saccharopolyspora antimicrobica]SFN94869.1 error-prone DNA polymerase [Saccharopolyspora antimicrobica]
MSWFNPPQTWSELETALSGRPGSATGRGDRDERCPGDGNDGPMWTRQDAERRSDVVPAMPPVPYAELHAHSNFSFLDGASHPEELVAEAARLGLEAIALTDHDGLYGVVRFAEAAAEHGMRTVFGAELSLGLTAPQNGVPDPEGRHLLVLARDLTGYASLCREISKAQLAGKEKGRPVYELAELAAAAEGHWQVLTGCRKGSVPAALAADGFDAAAAELDGLVALFGADHVAVELTDHGMPADSARNDALTELAARAGVATVASTGAHLARPEQARLAGVVAAIRARRSLDEADGWLPAWAGNYLRSGAEMAELFARYPGAVQRAAELGKECAFDLQLVAPQLPPFRVPKGRTEASWLRELTYQGALQRYGLPQQNPAAYQQIEHELAVIEELRFPGYFLIVQDIVEFCRSQGILCQGRGSAANSAVCFALRITNADPVRYQLLFERFLAPERDGPPDIDLDIESDRREEVIQYVYRTYGRMHAAQVANVISYRPRSAVRDVARALGYSPGQQDAWSKEIEHWGPLPEDSEIPGPVRQLAGELMGFPRHLGIHSGGMVICHQPVSEVCPVEWARMPGRTVLQWDKDDCAEAGLVKFDLLGLGMLSALRYATEMVREHHGREVDLGRLDLADDAVYEMLRRADAVGVFQVESRAQLATLPRLKPREFYDLVVEVALIRPGPIQGGSVHPYIRRRNGAEEWDFEHPLMAGALAKTYGVPLFQEQLMQLAVDVAGFSPAEADQLRRAMGAKRSEERMARLKDRLFEGMAANGISGALADRIYQRMLAFANYGFPESHALSFALLVFASAWFKRYYPAAFCAALLKAQPMGFYSPQSLVADARRHGVRVRGPDVNASRAQADLEPDAASEGRQAVRLGLASVRGLGDGVAEKLVAERAANGPYTGMAEVARRVELTAVQMEALATAGAFGCFGLSRREALWNAAAAAGDRSNRLPGTTAAAPAPALPGMDGIDVAAADVWATGVSPDSFPLQFVRSKLDSIGALPAARLSEVEHGSRVLVGGAVTHRQRPATAGGITFLNLEDETGMVNVMCSPGLWARYRKIGRSSAALLVRGIVERAEGVINLRADRLQKLEVRIPSTSRDFH